MTDTTELPTDTLFAERSPLWMVSQEPILNELVVYLAEVRERISANPGVPVDIAFSRTKLRRARYAFDAMIRKGEDALHRLCELFCGTFLSSYQMESVVIGEVPTTQERFTMSQLISHDDLHSTMDLDLGNRQLLKLRYHDGREWVSPSLVANVVEYQPTEPNRYGIYKIISRIKAEEEIWNKVVDELFDLDSLVRRDKQLSHLSRYVKDVFGIKIVVGTGIEVAKFYEVLELFTWQSDAVEKIGLPVDATTTRLEFLEAKNYLGATDRKASGWEARKSVVRWHDRTFEIQIQPLKNFWREREHITRESHSGFKSRREDLRDEIAKQVPLFRFFRELLRWVFADTVGKIPHFPDVRVHVTE